MLALAFGGGCAAGLAGCGSSDEDEARAVVGELRRAIDADDGERACRLLTQSARSRLDDCEQDVAGAEPAADDAPLSIDGDRATIGAPGSVGRMTLRKVDGSWRIDALLTPAGAARADSPVDAAFYERCWRAAGADDAADVYLFDSWCCWHGAPLVYPKLHERGIARVAEAVRRLGRDHDHRAGPGLDALLAARVDGVALDQHEHLVVRVDVQAHLRARGRAGEEERQVDVRLAMALEQRGGGAEPQLFEREQALAAHRAAVSSSKVPQVVRRLPPLSTSAKPASAIIPGRRPAGWSAVFEKPSST